MKNLFLSLTAALLLAGCSGNVADEKVVELHNPILPGYFADPSIVQYEGKFYIYATTEPWGTDFLSCWVSDDFQDWTFHTLNWPTKAACSTLQSGSSMVWAPSVIERDGMFYMYISVGSEVWCGRASHPLGPWENALGDRPMIPYDTTMYYHVIDAEAFIDDDGRAYLYWGSGWNWINGHCFAAELNEDMATFKTEPKEVTPTRYFEAPWMIRHDGSYYLTYSEGITMDETYEVRYAVGDNPFGPFTEAENSPILTYSDDLQVYGPGHHTFFAFEGKNYILYHRHRLPFVTGEAYRQICINEFTFDDVKKQIHTIVPNHTQVFPNLAKSEKEYTAPSSVAASSVSAPYREAKFVLDNDYSTRWEAAENDLQPTLRVDFGKEVSARTLEIRFEYPWKNYYVKVESSVDGNSWQNVADHTSGGISGSPVNIPLEGHYRFVRLSFDVSPEEARPSVWEFRFY